MVRIEALVAWFCSCLAVVLLGVSILVVPANLFADAGTDCATECGSDPTCIAGCCVTKCVSDPDPTVCGLACCGTACNDNPACTEGCAQAVQKKCAVQSKTCEPDSIKPQCIYSVSNKRCFKEGEKAKSNEAFPKDYMITDRCNVKGAPNSCGGCECRELIINGVDQEKCACFVKVE